MAEALIEQQRQCGRFALDLAAYREEFDRLEHNFAALESYVASVDIGTPQEIFAYPVGVDSIDLASGNGRKKSNAVGRTIMQLLPVNSIGVSGISIALSAIPQPGTPPLHVTLRAIETDVTIGNWVLNAAERAVGWTSLQLDRAIDAIALSLVIEVTWSPGGAGWRLDLGPPHPNAGMCAQVRNGEPLSAPIAMRIVGSVPGSTPATTTDIVLPTGARMSLTALVPKSAYEAVGTFGHGVSDEIPLVLYDPDAEFIQVHPNGPGKITVARMIVTAPNTIWRLSARTHLAHENANPTDFGILVVSDSEALPDLAQFAKERRARPGFSGWQTLNPLQHGSLSVLLSSPAHSRLSVYLLTKQETTHEYAWARFSALQLHLGPPSLVPLQMKAEPLALGRSTDRSQESPTKSQSPRTHASKHGKNRRRAPR